MLFKELRKIDEAQIHQQLKEQLLERGLSPELLRQSLGEGVTVESLMTDVLDALVTQAAEENRESFRARQRIGMERALEDGKPIGRPRLRSEEAFARVRAQYEARELSGAQAAAALGVSRGTFYRWLKETPEDKPSEKCGGGGLKTRNLINNPVFQDEKSDVICKSAPSRPAGGTE